MIKAQLLDSKAQLSDTKAQLSRDEVDWELRFFHEIIIKKLENNYQEKTLSKIEELFSRYRYAYSFNRINIAELFGVTENRASVIIKTCVECGVMVKQKNGVYGFVKQK